MGTRIGAVAGSSHEKLARAFFPKATVTAYANESLLYEDLNDAKLDTVFGDAMRLAFYINGTLAKACCKFEGGSYYSSAYLGEGMRIAVARDRQDLGAALDRALFALQKRGALSELYLRFFPAGFY